MMVCCWEKMYIIRDDSQLATLFREAEDATRQKNMGVYIQRRKVRPTLPVLEVGGDRKSVMGTSRRVVNGSLKTVVQ
jgi:hypothetical protein